MPFFYEVTVTAASDDIARRWIEWMRSEHLRDVVAAGASAGRVVRLDEPPLTMLAQYEFTSRAAYERYVNDQAPRLREAGLRLFAPPAVTYARRCGEIVIG